MKLIAISRVRNERDIIEAFVRHHAHVFDQLIVLDDGSTDGTFEILQALRAEGLALVLIRDPAVGYEQNRYLTRLLRMAVQQYGADWVMPLDADEFVEPERGKTLAQILDTREQQVLKLVWNGFVWRPEDDKDAEPNPVVRLRWRMPPSPDHLRKVLVPASLVDGAELAQGAHDLVRHGEALRAQPTQQVRLCHFPIRTVEQYASKVAVGYLQYSATPGWNRHSGFHYLEPYRLLTEGLDRLSEAMNRHSRHYSLEADWPDLGEPREAPFDYNGGPLAFTDNAAKMLGNMLHCAETIAEKFVEGALQIRTAQEALLAAGGAPPDTIARIVKHEAEARAVVHEVSHVIGGTPFEIDSRVAQRQTKHTFQSLWVGGQLTPYVSSCLKSFIDCGHALDLYTFDPNMRVPPGVRVRDAREFFSPEDSFIYSDGFGKGSSAAFANLFRYRLLAEKGGWWVDADVLCLAKDIPTFESFFAWQDTELINTAVMHFEPGDPVIVRCLSEATAQGRTVRWGDTGPYLFTRVAKELGYAHRALPSHVCYPTHYSEAVDILRPSRSASLGRRMVGSFFVHLWNEMLQHFGVEKTKLPPKGSMLRCWIERHCVDGWNGEYGAEELEQPLLGETELRTRLTADLAIGIEEIGLSNASLKSLNASLSDHNAALKALNASLSDHNASLKALNASLLDHNAALRAECDVLIHNNELVLNSTSWKLTAPVRTVGRALNWIRRRDEAF